MIKSADLMSADFGLFKKMVEIGFLAFLFFQFQIFALFKIQVIQNWES